MPKFSDSPAQILRKSCTAFQKSLRSSPSLHFRMDGKWPFPRQKSLSSVPSGTILIEYTRELLFSKTLEWPHFMGSLKPSNIWSLVFTEGRMELIIPLLPPQVLPSVKSHQQNVTHTWILLLPIHPNTSQNWTLQRLAGSLHDWNFSLQLLWNGWSLSFLQLIRKYLFKRWNC